MSQSDHLGSYGSTLATMEILENIWEVVSSYENSCASVGVHWQLLEYDCNPLKTIRTLLTEILGSLREYREAMRMFRNP